MKENEISKQEDFARMRAKLVDDVCQIIESGKKEACVQVEHAAILTYWRIGERIVVEEQDGKARAAYGKKIIPELAAKLNERYGSGYNRRNLAYYRKFYLCFSDIEILHTCVQNLTWSHIRLLIHVEDPKAREWYLSQTQQDFWSVRTLERNITTQYYGRLLACQREHIALPSLEILPQLDEPQTYIKNPIVAEFLDFAQNKNYTETQLEQALIDNLEQFIMELGRGFAFVARQKHIRTDMGDFYIDLVFYNYRMKRFVVFELKTHTLTHQDVGQLDMYVRMCDELVKDENDNPTIGVLLCTDTDKTIARYSVLKDSDQLFAAKYMPYMPTEEELSMQIEKQKQFFLAQHGEGNAQIDNE
ncbi:MAG: DUF1016 domain-containing protein [Bacteroidales bacterium]|nr:DUF1016 domain-containing protein [Bacteroidales bacterium]